MTDTTNQTPEWSDEAVEAAARAWYYAEMSDRFKKVPDWDGSLMRTVRKNFIGYMRTALAALPSDAVRLAPQGDSLTAMLTRQREWSREVFGPGDRLHGILDHIRKELDEIEAAPRDVSEWIDVVILALDGAWRAEHEPEDIVAALLAKYERNRARQWPDWRTAPEGAAIEHVRAPQDDPEPIMVHRHDDGRVCPVAQDETRDDAEEWADKLAYAIAPESVIGEHSSGNSPWANALEHAAQENRAEYAADAAEQAAELSGLQAEKQQLLDQELLHREQAGEMAEEIERLRDENERVRIALADAMAAPHTKTTDELVGWTRDLYVEFGKLLARQVKTGGELAQARRDLEEAKGQADPKYTAGGGLNPTSNAVPATLEVDGESGAWYIRLLGEPVTRTTEQPGPVNVDWTADGRLVGVEVLPDQAGTGDTAQPGEDVIEQAAQVLCAEEVCSTWEADDGTVCCNGQCKTIADRLAAAGLLAARSPLAPIEDPWTTETGLAATADDYPDLPNADFGHEPSQGTKVTLAQAREIGKGILRDAEQRRAHARDNDPDSQESGQGDPVNEECTDIRCRRIDGRCVGMHCAKCGGPCGPQGHIGGCPPGQSSGDTEECRRCQTAPVWQPDSPGVDGLFCESCFDRCHEATEVPHRCPVCDYVIRRPATEAKGQDEGPPAGQLVTIFCPNCSTLMTVAEHENHDCRPAASEGATDDGPMYPTGRDGTEEQR